MNKSKLVIYAGLGSLVTVLIWSFIGGCHNGVNNDDNSVPEEVITSAEEVPEKIPKVVETEEIMVKEEIIPPRPAPEQESKPPVRDVPPVPTEETEKIHVVEKGDTLWAISHNYGVTVDAIQEANGIDDAGRLSIGQKLIIP